VPFMENAANLQLLLKLSNVAFLLGIKLLRRNSAVGVGPIRGTLELIQD